MKSSSGESIASVARYAHSMPAVRSRPHTTSASDSPDTTFTTTASSASTAQRLLAGGDLDPLRAPFHGEESDVARSDDRRGVLARRPPGAFTPYHPNERCAD